MRVLLFGATGMVGQGVLRECLLDPGVESVRSITRTPGGETHPKLRELVHADFFHFESLEPSLAGVDACFFCLGATSAGKSEEEYSRVTYDITMAAARVLARLNPDTTFIFVSGMGSDSTERSSIMWARVKGKTENAILEMFPKGYAFRPGVIIPLDGIRSRTVWYRLGYTLATPLLPFLKGRFPGYVTTTRQIGQAMLRIARNGAPKRVLESVDINRI